jgi:hypothetical protein
MVSTAYSFVAQNIDGSPATNLNPVVVALKRDSDNTDISGVVITFTEITRLDGSKSGFYKFYYDPIQNGEAFIQIDLGSSLPAAVRYVSAQLTADSTSNLLASLIDSGLSLGKAVKAMAAVLFGNAVASNGSIAYKDQAGTTIITGNGFDGAGSRIITKENL